jgi:K+ transporter
MGAVVLAITGAEALYADMGHFGRRPIRAATVIASQAVISGAFSVSHQAMRLGYPPHLTVRHTSWQLALVAVVLGGAELTYFAANLTEVVHGGWLPLLSAAGVAAVMSTWRRGRETVTRLRVELEGPLPDFLARLRAHGVERVPGTAVFPHPDTRTAPLALRANARFNRVVHERVVVVSVVSENVPHVPPGQRLSVEELGLGADGVVHLTARFGFQDAHGIPAVLRGPPTCAPSSTSTPPRPCTSCPASPSSAAPTGACAGGASGCSSRWRTTRPAPRPTPSCPWTGRW